jgi:uncharacterized membrane protein
LTRLLAGPIFCATGADVRRASFEADVMADYPAPQSTSAVSTAPVGAGLLAYALFALAAIMQLLSSGMPLVAPFFGLLGIIGIVVLYVKRDEARGTWLESHFTWLIRTFWWSLLWAVLGAVLFLLLAIVLIGFLVGPAIWFVAGIWVIYRVIRGYLLFKDSKPIPGV